MVNITDTVLPDALLFPEEKLALRTDALSTDQLALELSTDGVPPIDHESNRLGTIVHEHDGHQIRRHKDIFFVWFATAGRGRKYTNLYQAAEHIGLQKLVGYADFEGTIKAGKLLERGPNGEIWKDTSGRSTTYYVWINGTAHCFSALYAARAAAGINTSSKKELTLTAPKSAYPQNQKGYKAGSITKTKGK